MANVLDINGRRLLRSVPAKPYIESAITHQEELTGRDAEGKPFTYTGTVVDRYVPRAGYAINPNMSAVADVPPRYWVYVKASNRVREMYAAEKAAVDAAEAQAQADRQARARREKAVQKALRKLAIGKAKQDGDITAEDEAALLAELEV